MPDDPLPDDPLGKADPRLRRELERGEDGERRLRVVMVLDRAGGGRPGDGAPRPADHPDRVAWRRALLEHRRREAQRDLEPVRRELEELGLEVRGGGTGAPSGAVVVVAGPAPSVRRALRLARVRKATLDREVDPGAG